MPAFTAGAHIDVELPNGETRSYSLLNDQGPSQRYVIGVLRETESRGGSAYMHEELDVGDTLQASPPSNDFALYEAGEVNILIAGVGGTGITSLAAIMGMAPVRK